MNVLDHGFVELEKADADDLSVVNSARVSFLQRSDMVSEKEVGLIRFLLRGRHGTPFEHNSFTFRVKTPLFVAREWMRHRIGSYNEHSLRYSEAIEDFYVPQNVRTQVGKPGAYTFESVAEHTAQVTRAEIRHAYAVAWAAYNRMLADKVAKEVARVVLPVGLYTEFYWTVNARSLMNFISLRNSEFAQFEIQQYAEVVEALFAQKMPQTHAAFVEFGRVAP